MRDVRAAASSGMMASRLTMRPCIKVRNCDRQRLPQVAGLQPVTEGARVRRDGTQRTWHGHGALRIIPRTHRLVVLGVLHLSCSRGSGWESPPYRFCSRLTAYWIRISHEQKLHEIAGGDCSSVFLSPWCLQTFLLPKAASILPLCQFAEVPVVTMSPL